MDIARQPQISAGFATVFSLALVLTLPGCGDHPGQTEGSQKLVKVHFRLPWVNATGRTLESAELRFHGLSYSGVEHHLSDMKTPGLATSFFDDVGNLTWVYRFADVEARATGVVEIDAVVPLRAAADKLTETELARYQGLEGLSDQEESYIAEHREATCTTQSSETLTHIRALISRPKEMASVESSGDEVDPDNSSERTGVHQDIEMRAKTSSISTPEVVADERLAALMARTCGLATRSVIGVNLDNKVQTGAHMRIWNDVYLDDHWEALLDEVGPGQPQQTLTLRIFPDMILANDATSLHRNIFQTVGLSVDPGAMQIALIK